MNLGDIKHVFFVGIGGIGMSALARYFKMHGAIVAGYDRTPSPLTLQLSAEGMNVFYDDDPEKLPENIDLAIYTPAIPDDLKIFNILINSNIPLEKRASVLGKIAQNHETIAITGTHGKTTTSAILAHIFYQSSIGCTAFIGGIVNNYQSNFFSKGNGPMIVEADEYDRSLLYLKPKIAAINSMDADHLDIYENVSSLYETYNLFANQIDKNGFLMIKKGLESFIFPKVACYTAALDNVHANFYAKNIHIVDGFYRFDFHTPEQIISDITFGGGGLINIANAVMAAAIAWRYGIGEDILRAALQSFNGVYRRFEFRIRTPKLVLIDDYAHHPEEIKASLQSVRNLFPGKKITVVFQPHLYSRTRDFVDGFAEALTMADDLLLLDIYPARELPMEGIHSGVILEKMIEKKGKIVTKEALANIIFESKPEVVVMLGAGDIDRLVEPVEKKLRSLL